MARYWWFQGASVEELTRQLLAAGFEARLEVHPHGADGLMLYVVPPGAKQAERQGINESHPCPPQCVE